MKIDSQDTISNISIIKIRGFLRNARDQWSSRHLEKALGLHPEHTETLVNELLSLGLIEYVDQYEGEKYWGNTIKGNALANASAAKSVNRKTAEKALNLFLERVEHVNSNPYYLYKVKRVLIFGSFLSDSETVNDIDLAIELTPKEVNPNIRNSQFEQRRKEALENGRSFGTFVEELFWPEKETRLYLKSRSRILSFHSFDRETELLKQIECQEIFKD